MALIQCPECKREISDKAEWCVGCGMPLKNPTESNDRLTVPNQICKSSSGNYLRFIGIITWIGGAIASVVLSMRYDGYGNVTGWNWVMFLLCAVCVFFVGLVPCCFAGFFDDVHTIRCTLQGIRWGKAEEKMAGENNTAEAAEQKKADSASCIYCGATVYFDSLPDKGITCQECGKKLLPQHIFVYKEK